jgi:hypothetical protein
LRIEYAIPAKYAEVNDNLATIVGAGIDTFGVPELPTVVNTMVAVRVVGTHEEMHGHHRLRCLVRNEEHEIVGPELDAEFDLDIGVANELREDWLQNTMLSLGIQFDAESEGAYTITVMVDEAEIAVPFFVRQITV